MTEQRVIELREWQKPTEVSFSAAEAEVLRRLQQAKRVAVTWHGPTDAAISGSAGFVGMAALSEETQVLILPHIPVASVLALVCYAYEFEPPEKSLIEDARLDDTGPGDWLAFLLTLEVEKLLSQGLRLGYREIEQDLPYVRGRIDFDALRWGESRPGLVPCRFEEFVVDTIENRILRGTLEILSASPLSTTFHRRLRSTLAAFSRVSLVRPTRQMFDRSQLNRLSSYYEPALRLCRLVLETSGIELDAGDVATPGFFFSMADVFEKAIERALREEFGAQNVHSQPEYNDRIRVVDGEPMIPVTLIPDNVIGQRDAPRLIVDAKYKKPLQEHYGDRFHNPDLYQAFTYAGALGVPAVLVYPRVDQDIDVTFEVGGCDARIVVMDLREPVTSQMHVVLSSIHRESDSLTRKP